MRSIARAVTCSCRRSPPVSCRGTRLAAETSPYGLGRFEWAPATRQRDRRSACRM